MADVFVSYKAEDRGRIRPLIQALEADGLTVWWDAQLEGGEAWREAIAEQLDSAPCVLVVWSKRSVGPEGRFVRDEAARAQRRGTYLPVAIDKVQPPLGFGELQAIPLTGWKGVRSDTRYQAVNMAAHAMLGRAPVDGAKWRPLDACWSPLSARGHGHCGGRGRYGQLAVVWEKHCESQHSCCVAICQFKRR